jgi:hypothetical protein
VIGNKYDPVTPYTSAIEVTKAMNEGHAEANAVLLTSNSIGHCSTAQASKCVKNYVREYLINGTLPAHGIVCEPDEELFSKKRTSPLFIVNRDGRRAILEEDIATQMDRFHKMKSTNFII